MLSDRPTVILEAHHGDVRMDVARVHAVRPMLPHEPRYRIGDRSVVQLRNGMQVFARQDADDLRLLIGFLGGTALISFQGRDVSPRVVGREVRP